MLDSRLQLDDPGLLTLDSRLQLESLGALSLDLGLQRDDSGLAEGRPAFGIFGPLGDELQLRLESLDAGLAARELTVESLHSCGSARKPGLGLLCSGPPLLDVALGLIDARAPPFDLFLGLVDAGPPSLDLLLRLAGPARCGVGLGFGLDHPSAHDPELPLALSARATASCSSPSALSARATANRSWFSALLGGRRGELDLALGLIRPRDPPCEARPRAPDPGLYLLEPGDADTFALDVAGKLADPALGGRGALLQRRDLLALLLELARERCSGLERGIALGHSLRERGLRRGARLVGLNQLRARIVGTVLVARAWPGARAPA